MCFTTLIERQFVVNIEHLPYPFWVGYFFVFIVTR
nr:MAG TPA: hypothetical protein [Caudoviricetes sp.]